jgi:uncharacterized RDD family membrane protein YckC
MQSHEYAQPRVLAGATAVAIQPQVFVAEPEPEPVDPKVASIAFRNARQPSLWDEQNKIIEFPRGEGQAEVRRTELPRPPRPDAKRPRRAAPKNSLDDTQPCLDFSLPPQNSPKTLKTSVEASIYCDFAAATPVHRAVSSAIDAGVVVLGGAVFATTFWMGGGSFTLDPFMWIMFLISLALIGVFYGFLFVLADGETLGRQATGLRTVNFDGQPIGRKSRLLRLAAAQLSIFSATLGLLWSLVDEESLTWHDHMARSFPTSGE